MSKKSLLIAWFESSFENPGETPNFALTLIAKSISSLDLIVPNPRVISGNLWNSLATS